MASISLVEMGTPLVWEAGKEGDRWVVLKPREEGVYVGPVKGEGSVRPERTGGTWYPRRLRTEGEVGEYVVMHVHGMFAFFLLFCPV